MENFQQDEDKECHYPGTAERILTSARNRQGLERLDQIKFAILEKNGKISIIPQS